MAAPLIKVGAGYIEITPDFSKFKTSDNVFNKQFGTVGKNAGQAFVTAFQTELKTGLGKVANSTIKNVDLSSGVEAGAKKAAKNVVFAWEDAAGKIRFINKQISDGNKAAFDAEPSISGLRKVSQEYKTQAAVIQQAQTAQAAVERKTAAEAEQNRRKQVADMNAVHVAALRENADMDRLAASIRGTYTGALRGAQKAYTDLAGTQRTVSTANATMGKSFVQMGKDLDKVSASLDRSTKAGIDWWSAGNRMIGLGQQITQNVTVPFIGAAAIIGKFGIDSATALQRSQNSLAALIGGPNSVQAAKTELQSLANFAQHTNFDLKGVQTAAVQLQAAGLSAKQAQATIEGFGNAATVSGQDSEQFNRTMKALAQSYAAVKVNAQDMKQMQDAQLPVWHDMAEATGKSELELRNMSKSGELLASDVFPVLNNYFLTNSKYAGMAAKGAETMGGKLQNLQEIFKFKLGIAFQENQGQINKLIDGFGKLLDALIPAITGALPTLVTLFKAFTSVLTVVATVFQAMPGWAKAGITGLVAAVAIAGPVLIGLGIAIKTVSVSFTGLKAAMTGISTNVAGGFLGLTTLLGQVAFAVTAVIAVYQLWNARSQEAKQRQEDLTAAIEADSGAIGRNTREAVVNALEKQKVGLSQGNVIDTAQKLGVNLKTLTDAFTGNGQATQQVIAQLQQYTATGLKGSKADIDRAVAAKAIIEALQAQQGNLGNAVQAAKNHAAALGTDTNAAKQNAGAQAGLVPPALQAASAFTQQYLAMRKVSDQKLSDTNANLAFRSSLYSLGDAIKSNSHSLNEYTRDGLSNRQAALSTIDLAYKQADAIQKSTGSADAATQSLVQARNQLYAFMVQTGANAGAVRAFLNEYMAIPNHRTITMDVVMRTIKTDANGNTTYPTGPNGTGTGAIPNPFPDAAPKAPSSFKYTPPPSLAAQAKKQADDAAKQRAKQLAEQRAQEEKAFKDSGSSLLKSFAQGLNADAPTLRSNLDAMADSIRQAFAQKGQSGVNSLLGSLDKLGDKLVSLAKQRDAVFAKLQEAQDFATQVTGNATSAASLSNLPFSTTTPQGIAVGLQSRLQSITKFANVIKQLVARKLNKSLLQQVIEAGPIDGLALGQSILAADKNTFSAINDAQKQIDAQAKALGGLAADSIFGSVDAMAKKGASLEKQMESIAKKAISLVGNAFHLGWTNIKNITSSGMSVMNNDLSDKLGKTKSVVSAAASANKTNWAAMVSHMNDSTKSLVNTTYGKGVAPTINAMASLAGIKNPAPTLKFSEGGVIPGYAPRVDDVPAVLSRGEGVMVPEFVRAVGPSMINDWNAKARAGKALFANGGIVGGDAWVAQHKNDPFAGYDDALTHALKAVVDPSLALLGKMSGAFSSLEVQDTQKGYPWLHTWAQKLDKLANAGGSATAVLKVAKGELGGPGSHSNKYNAFNNEAWCADFVSWVVDHAHANKAYWNSPHPTPQHRWGLADAWNHPADRVGFNKAQPGDVINWPGQHVGVVERGYANGSVGTIEGNHNPRYVVRATRGNGVISRPHWSALPNSNGEFVSPWPGSIPKAGGGVLGNIPVGQFKGQEGNSPSQNRNLGLSILKNMGWDNYWGAVDYIFQHESSWNHHAQNRSSGAYGIPQSLPGSKMKSQGADWRTNPVTQIYWGLNYMKSRYGNPNKAETFWKSHHWYENGAWDIPGLQAAILHKGEMVVPERPAEAFRDALAKSNLGGRSSQGAGVTYAVTIHAAPDIPTEQTIIKALSYAHTMYGRG